MEENKLTVLIPSIGRESVFKSIESVDYAREIHILLMRNSLNDLPKKNKHDIPIFWHFYSGVIYPGLAKRELIKFCTTKYFIILDDDDEFVNEFLEPAVKMLDATPNAHWYCAHRYNTVEFITKYHKQDAHHISAIGGRSNLIYKFSDYTTDINPEKIYPYSTSIFSLEAYRYIAMKGCGFDAFPEYGDDIIPGYSLIYLYSGILDTQHFLVSEFGDGSVSRRFCPEPLLNSLIYKINEYCNFMSTTYRDIMIDNVINKINYTNKHYEQASK